MKRLYRCRWNRKALGVLGGLGIYLNIDPTILRIIFVSLIIPTGIIVLPILYFLASFIIPEGPASYIAPHCKLLYRSSSNKKLAGVCGGIGEFFGIDPNIIRIVAIIALILSAGLPVILIYIICAIIMPLKPH